MAFQRIIHVVNRTTSPLEVTDDGVPWVIRPGYKAQPKLEDGQPVVDDAGEPVMEYVGAGPGGTVFMEPLPYFAAERAKRQNPLMGTEDPMNPNDFVSLIAVPDWGDEYGPLEQSDALERIDRQQLPEQLQNIEVVAARGGRKKVGRRNPKTGKFEKVIPGARGMVAGETSMALENFAFSER